MTATDVTTYRDAVRRRIAQVAAGVIVAATALVILLASSVLFSPEFASDFENGTKEFRNLDTITRLIGYTAPAIPAAAAIGAVFGLGRCRSVCVGVLIVVGVLVLGLSS